MSVSVCTLVRNRNGMLRRLVEGLRRSTVPPRELLVVQAGGEDPAPALAGVTEFPVRVERLEGDDERIPYAPARNLAARRATGSVVCFMDADAIPWASTVGAFDEAMRGREALAIGEIVYLPPGAVGDGWREEDLRAVGRPHPARPVPPARGADASDAYTLVWGTCFAITRECFLRLGGFDEGYRGYAGEDTDLAVTARAAGVPLLVVAGAGVLHQHHDVWEPPVQQFRATLANARRFRDRHGWWPMGGWLDGFRDLGLIEWDGREVRILRDPTPEEVERARRTAAAGLRVDG